MTACIASPRTVLRASVAGSMLELLYLLSSSEVGFGSLESVLSTFQALSRRAKGISSVLGSKPFESKRAIVFRLSVQTISVSFLLEVFLLWSLTQLQRSRTGSHKNGLFCFATFSKPASNPLTYIGSSVR